MRGTKITAGLFLLICAIPHVILSQTKAEIKEASKSSPTVMVNASTQKTKAALVGTFTESGYVLQNDSTFLLVFTRPVEVPPANVAAFMFGAGTSDPQENVRLTLVDHEGTTRVSTSTSIVSTNQYGRERTMDYNSNGKHNLRVRALLESAKSWAEGEPK
jgi:hypothetical protein